MTKPPEIAALVEAMRQRNVTLTMEGARLAIRAPKNALSEDDKRVLALNRDAIVRYLGDEPAEAGFPLTEIQTAYWIGRQSAVLGGVGCHAYREFRLNDLDPARLQRAWNLLIQRHEMLRAVFTDDGMQRILPDVPEYRFDLLDLRDDPDAVARQDTLRQTMSHHLFDAKKWPLFDIRLTRMQDGLYLHMGLDLLIADAASILLIYREWQALYDNIDADLPPLTRRFSEYVLQQGTDEIGLRNAEAYWRPRLAALPGSPQLPQATPPSNIATPHFTRRSIRLDSAAWAGLSERAAAAGMTPSRLLLAVFCDILAAYSRAQQFLLTLTTFRAPSEFAGVVGDFTSTLLVNVDARAPRFRDRAAQIQDALADALEHDGWSGVRVARELARLRADGGGPVPVVFTSALGHRSRGAAGDPVGWLGDTRHAITQTPQVWMDHHVIEEADGLTLSFDVVDGLFPDGVLADMIQAHERLVRALAADAAALDWPLGAHLSPVAVAERAAANATAIVLAEHPLHAPALVPPQDRTAVISGGDTLTYGALRDRAAGIALALRARGLSRQETVAVSLAKGGDQIAATLGVLMAGGVYVPVSPDHPATRRDGIVGRAAIRFALTDGSSMSWPEGVAVIDVTGLAPAPAPAPHPTDPDDLAYVIFTSGSTGTPKGVMVEHRAAVNTIEDMCRRFGLGAGDVFLGLSDLGFDLSVFDIFAAFATGGRLVLPDAARLRDPQHWIDMISAQGVTVWNSVPALAGMLAEMCDQPLDSLRLILLSGDWVPVGLMDRLRRIAPNARIIALGGATEAAIWSNWYDTADLAPGAKSVPYGWPLGNQRYHVLNEALQPCPPGVTGQLHIAGRGLARGYLGDPDQTGARFFDHPVTGERLYATGDLGCYLPGGAIAFLGRDDAQVKIDGHRIELGEIEAALCAHPRIREAAAFVVETAAGGRRLGAAVVEHLAERAEDSQTLESSAALLRLKQGVALRPVDPGQARVALPGSASLGPRRSIRAFRPVGPDLDQIGRLLALLAVSEDGGAPSYRYPSAGGIYPVQVWLHLKHDVGDAPAGLYAYHRLRHDLEPVSADVPFPIDEHAAVNHAIAQSACFAIYFVLNLDAIQPSYGSFARDFGMIEVGAMTQLLMEQAAALGIGLCPTGGLDASGLSGPMALSDQQVFCLTLLGGRPGQGGGALNDRAVRDHLTGHLPAYMIPDRIVTTNAIALTANGKVDRATMAAAFAGQTAPIEDSPKPAHRNTGQTGQIAAIMAEVLGRPTVDPDDGVFDLGGTSLHVVRLHRRLMDRLGADIDIIDLFRNPSVSGIAALLRGQTGRQDGTATARGTRRRAETERRASPGTGGTV